MGKHDEYDDELSVSENQARALYAIARAIDGLTYSFRYGKSEGLSVAEAIEVAGKSIAGGIEVMGSSIASELTDISVRLEDDD